LHDSGVWNEDAWCLETGICREQSIHLNVSVRHDRPHEIVEAFAGGVWGIRGRRRIWVRFLHGAGDVGEVDVNVNAPNCSGLALATFALEKVVKVTIRKALGVQNVTAFFVADALSEHIHVANFAKYVGHR